jgi:ribonucleoside-diphosphate reductase alpha chain
MYSAPDRAEWLVAANDISPEEHVLMQAAAQRYNDSSISKTANAPEDHTVEDVRNLYLMAYHEGLKSISYYRDNSRQVQVLYHKKGDETVEVSAEDAIAAATALLASKNLGPVRRKLPDERNAITHKFRVGEQEGYMTVGLFDDGTPGEVFINVNKQGSTVSGLMDTVAMLTSYALQYGVPLSELSSKLKNTRFEPSGPTGNQNIPIATSIIDYVFRWLELKFDGGSASQPTLIPADLVVPSTTADTHGGKYSRGVASGVGCPECGEVLFVAEGCLTCRTCGYTKCG